MSDKISGSNFQSTYICIITRALIIIITLYNINKKHPHSGITEVESVYN